MEVLVGLLGIWDLLVCLEDLLLMRACLLRGFGDFRYGFRVEMKGGEYLCVVRVW